MNSRAGCPTYRISSADPSATWVHLHNDWFAINQDSKIHFILYLKFNQDKYCIFIYFPKSIWNWEGIFERTRIALSIFLEKYLKTSVVITPKLLYNNLMSKY